MTELLDLCYDVLIRILEEINPSDLAACAATSSGFHEFIKRNKRLYKAHYLQNFVCLSPVFLDFPFSEMAGQRFELHKNDANHVTPYNRMIHDEDEAMMNQIG